MTPEYLKTILRYEPDTGKLYWLERDKSHGKRFRWFNSNHAGKEALTAKKPCGHTHGLINRKSYMAHRVAD